MATNAIHCAEDARRLARRRLPWMVFDYIDGAAGQEQGARRNRAALDRVQLRPRVLRNVQRRSLNHVVLDKECGQAFGISPMGMCNLAGHGADLMLARLAARLRIPHVVSTLASTSLEQIQEQAQGQAWLQLYYGEDSWRLIPRARAAGYQTLVLTVDVPEVGRRPKDLRNGFKMPFRLGPRQFIDFALHPRWSLSTLFKGRPELANFGGPFGTFDRDASRAAADWDYLRRLRQEWQGNLVVKGVMDPEDALRLRNEGVDAVQVSNHGGRQMESAPGALDALREIREAIGSEFPLFFDSGLRSGEDIVKAYASGADFVFFGRPLLYAIAASGESGLKQFAAVLQTELHQTLAQIGRCAITEVDQSCIA